nr:JAB domain-containing protein [Flavobacterium sp. F-126]
MTFPFSLSLQENINRERNRHIIIFIFFIFFLKNSNLKILLFNQSNKVLGIYEVTAGGIPGASVDLRFVFVAALKTNALIVIMIQPSIR